MPLISNISNLPERIQNHARNISYSIFLGAFKTDIKPDATIPILWIIFYDKYIMFCNTHKTRGLHSIIKNEEVDSFKIKKYSTGESSFQIIFRDLRRDDIIINLPRDITIDSLKEILIRIGVQIIIEK